MSKDQALICPICSLYLHPGVALGDHLNTHSKERVIELLWNLSNVEDKEGTTAGSSADGTVIETTNDTHNKRDFHQVDVEPPDEAAAERSTTCSFIYGTRSSLADGDTYSKDCYDDDDSSLRSDDSNENFENILIVIIVVAVIILYLKM